MKRAITTSWSREIEIMYGTDGDCGHIILRDTLQASNPAISALLVEKNAKFIIEELRKNIIHLRMRHSEREEFICKSLLEEIDSIHELILQIRKGTYDAS